jgi:hypothetical protein
MRDSEFMRGVIAWMIVFVVDVSELGPLFALAIISSSTNPKRPTREFKDQRKHFCKYLQLSAGFTYLLFPSLF